MLKTHVHDVDVFLIQRNLSIDLFDLRQLNIVKMTKKRTLMRLVSCHAKPVG